MGNQSVRSSDFNWGASDCAGDAGLSAGHKSRHKNSEPGVKKTKNCRRPRAPKNVTGRTTKSRHEFKKLRELFGDKIPIILALLTESHCRLSIDKTQLQRCRSELNNTILPCEQTCRRVKSYPCASFCPECDKKLGSMRFKQKRDV